ncbi:Rieske 2Fe-2S domain-containing protein [Paenibacillus validus]|uniref:Rieske 2Fe-2S domain-containing protein n=1 Tax=Paenibacillus validus TaxID=44253 RepID=UPI003D2E21AC
MAHESEFKEPGSYVTRWMVNDPVLLVKNSAGEIKAFLNSCTHRGTHLCTADFGKRKRLHVLIMDGAITRMAN